MTEAPPTSERSSTACARRRRFLARLSSWCYDMPSGSSIKMTRSGQCLGLITVALALFVGCGGRTGQLTSGFERRYEIDGGAIGQGGASSAGGAYPNNGGRYYGGGGYYATGGYYAVGGGYEAGGYYNSGGYSAGGYYNAGGFYDTGGYYAAGGYYNAGGYYAGGYYNAGGFYYTGGYYNAGGYYGGGGYPYCGYPNCSSCSSCFDQCLCYGIDTNSCYSKCYPATGGVGGGSSCDLTFCPNPVVPTVNLTLPACCIGPSCGVQMDIVAGAVPVYGGCQPPNQPGAIDSSCPSIASPVGGTIPGCCRSDGTCGIDLDVIGMGCSARSDVVQYCGFGGAGGFAGAGGFGTGGIVFGAGGFVGGGGVPAAGGAPDGGGAVDQCYSRAQSDCERCACVSCFGDIAPCFQDAGCPSILQCANQTGCTGTNCYQASTCQAVIDQNGGPLGTSVGLAQPLFSCIRQAGCPCGFAP